MKNKNLRSILLTALSLAIICVFVFYLYANADKYRELFQMSVKSIVMLFVLSLAFPLLNGMQNTFLYRSLGTTEFTHMDGFLLTAASTLANQLPVPGGIISKGFYLKRKHNLSYTKFASSTVALFICYIVVNGAMGMVILLSWMSSNKIVSPVLFAGYTGMIASLLIFWLPLERVRVPGKIEKWVRQAIDGWVAISRNPTLLLKIILLQVILVVLLGLRYWLAFHMLSQKVTISQTILLASASILTQLVSIAPGGLGVREAIVGAVASMLGFDIGISVIAVGLDRLVVTIMIVLAGWISTVILGKQIAEASVQLGKESNSPEYVDNTLAKEDHLE